MLHVETHSVIETTERFDGKKRCVVLRIIQFYHDPIAGIVLDIKPPSSSAERWP